MYFNNKKHIIVVMKMLFFNFVIQTHQKALKRSFSNFVFLNLYIDSLVSILQYSRVCCIMLMGVRGPSQTMSVRLPKKQLHHWM